MNNTTPPTPDKLAEAREFIQNWKEDFKNQFAEGLCIVCDEWYRRERKEHPDHCIHTKLEKIIPFIEKLRAAQDLVSRAEQKEEDAKIARLSSSCCEHEDPTCAEIIAKKILNP